MVNDGTLEATGSDGLIVHGDVANSGLLWANGGNIIIEGNVTGSGSALINGTATMEFGGAFNARVTLDDAAGTFEAIDHAAEFCGVVAGFDSNDRFDFRRSPVRRRLDGQLYRQPDDASGTFSVGKWYKGRHCSDAWSVLVDDFGLRRTPLRDNRVPAGSSSQPFGLSQKADA